MRLPQGYEVRAAREEDLPAAAEVMLAYDVADFGRRDFDLAFLRLKWSVPGFDPATDSWVVTGPSGTAVAYAQVHQLEPGRLDSFARVHPEHRDRGIEPVLMELVEKRARGRLGEMPGTGPLRLQSWIPSTDQAGEELLLRRGFAPVRHFIHMEIDLRDGTPTPQPRRDVTIRPFVPGADDRALHELLGEAFAEEWSYELAPFEEWVTQTREPEFDPGLWLLAVAGDNVVGAVIAWTWSGRGWIDELAVRPGWRRRGIGSWLLSHAFAEFADRGLTEVALNVDAENPTGATDVYERAGMRIRRRFVVYEKELHAGAV